MSRYIRACVYITCVYIAEHTRARMRSYRYRANTTTLHYTREKHGDHHDIYIYIYTYV